MSSGPGRGGTATTAAAVVLPVPVALLAVLALTRLSTGVVIALSVGAVALAVVVVRIGPERAAQGLLLLAVGTSPWNAVSVGPVKPTHAALAGAAVLLGCLAITGDRAVRVPWWVWVLGGSIAAASALSVIAPPSTAYFAARYIGDLPDDVAEVSARLGTVGLTTGAQWLVAGLALPVAVCLAAVRHPGLVPRLGAAWSLGAAVSAAVALTDRAGVTGISASLLPEVDSSRQAGLSVHPNHLALGVALALPLVAWYLVRARRPAYAVGWAGVAVVMAAGVVASGSRAGFVGVALALALALVVDSRLRRLVPLVAAAAVGALVVAAVALPSLFATLLADLRLSGSQTAAASDEIRAGLLAQALEDFAHAPLRGVGLAIVAEGHDIYLQLLAAGGVLLLVGYLVAQAGFLRAAWSVDDDGTELGRLLAASGAVYLVVGVVGNQLTDVFVAVPFALAAGMWATAIPRRPDVPTGARPQVAEREEISA